MPDLEISNLPALAGASVQGTDPVAIADLSAAETKKITVKDFIEGGVTQIADATIPAVKISGSTIGAGSVGTTELADLSVTTIKVAADAITFDKLQNVNTDILLGRSSAGTGDVEEIPCTAAGRALLDDADAAAQRTTLGLGTLATQSGTFSGISSGTNTGDQTITLTGDVTGTGTGTFATTLSALSVDTAELVDNAVIYSKIQDINTDVILGRATAGTGSVEEINCTAAGRALLDDADAAAQRVTLGLGQIAQGTGTWVNGSSFSGTSSGVNTGDQTISLTGDVTGSGTGAITASITTGAVGTNQLADASVTFAKTNFANNIIPGAKIVTDSITSTQIGPSAVGSSELASNACTTAKIADANVTDIKIASGIDGSKLSADTVTAAKIPAASLDRGIDKTSGSIGHTNSVSAGTANGITFDAQGHITGTSAITSAELPIATSTTLGGVKIPLGSGLSVNVSGDLTITNSLSAGTISGITFDSNGLITGTTGLVGSDLPVATTSTVGAVSVPASGSLEVNGTGQISVSASGVAAGTYPKVTVNAKGLVTSGSSLIAADIPDLSAAKLTSGTLDIARLSTNSITGDKLANSATVSFASAAQSGQSVTFPTAKFQGEFFFDVVQRDLYLWDGNGWQPITITSGEIIFAGTFSPVNNQIESLTTAGSALGLVIGDQLPVPAPENSQYYFVISDSATGQTPAPTVALNPPDIVISAGTGSNWELLDVSGFIASQQASNIAFVPANNISSSNVQDAIEELDNEKLPLVGGDLTGNLSIAAGSTLILKDTNFDGTIDTATLTAARAYTFPDVSGNIVTTGDTGTVTSTMIADGTITNDDVSGSAGIAFSKLAALTDAHLLVGNGSNVATAVAVTGDISIDNTGLTAIVAGSIVDADISGSAAIAASKIVSASTSGAGVVQLSDSTTSTSTVLAATANAVKVTKDVADAALPLAGGTISGQLLLGTAGTLVFEGATSDANKTTLAVTDPTSTRTITLPDLTGTVALTSQLDDGSY